MQNLLVENTNGVARLTLDKPPLNIMDLALMREMHAALTALRAQAGFKVLVIAARGRLFSAGVDIKDHTADRVGEMLGAFHGLLRLLWSFEQPTIAAVQGSALGGGCELALACDLIVASAQARFGQPEIQVGAFPPIAALLLSRLIPRKRAFELILTGDPIDGATAEQLGLVNLAAPSGEFEPELTKFVERLTRSSGAVLKLAKRAALIPLSREDERCLQEIEQLYLTELMRTNDANEGLAAFLEKRRPEWKDR